MLEPPPDLPSLEETDLLAAGDAGCPLDVAPSVCLTPAGAVKIRRAIADLKRYAEDAVLACGLKPDEGSKNEIH